MANCLPQSLAASKGGALICEGTAFGRSHNANGVYVFSGVGTSRCDVGAACSGATSSNASVARIFVPPATTRAGTAQRAIPTIALNAYPACEFWRLPAASFGGTFKMRPAIVEAVNVTVARHQIVELGLEAVRFP